MTQEHSTQADGDLQHASSATPFSVGCELEANSLPAGAAVKAEDRRSLGLRRGSYTQIGPHPCASWYSWVLMLHAQPDTSSNAPLGCTACSAVCRHVLLPDGGGCLTVQRSLQVAG